MSPSMPAPLPLAAACLAFLWTLLLPTAAEIELAGVFDDANDVLESVCLLQSSNTLERVPLNKALRRGTKLHAAAAVGSAIANASTCGMSKTEVKVDCQNADMGSCGNACCTLEVPVSLTPQATYEAVANFLSSGGGDGAYSFVPEEMPFGEHAPADLTSLSIPGGWKFIFQGAHTTSGRRYNDTLNFNIRTTDTGATILRAFSISDISGALGDAGQSYKTLAFLLKALNVDPASATLLHGCGSSTGPGISFPVLESERATAAQGHGSSTCGMNSARTECQQHADMGSCGNACCAMEVATTKNPDALFLDVSGFLRSAGDDGAYQLLPGVMPFGEHQPFNLTSLSIPGGWRYIVKGRHTTSGRHYNDSLYFSIRASAGQSVLRAFSVSDIHGALGDAGQNYKTLAYMIGGLGLDLEQAKILHGCNTVR